ncbi:MAG: DegT/DnrJ/EryC1/StrS family aminotransferase [Nitrospirae bacterium]|nr:DegT/DnrJ/EryC1/StrS family aminotransferase [Nitrospirota bacterium]
MKNNIRLSRSIVGQAEAEAVSRVLLEDGYLGMGKEVQTFEEEIAKFLEVPRDWVICVNSGTAALHLAVQTLTRPDDEVLVQALTYVASFQAIKATGAIPVACEVIPENITLDLDDAAKRLSTRTKIVMPVHYASNPGDLAAIYEFAKHHGLRVIEDAAHAFGCLYHGHKIGSQELLNQLYGNSPSSVVCFSFDGIKNITSGEGGVVITQDPFVAQKIRDARLLGVEQDTEKRYSGQRSWEFDVQQQGYRYHMSNIFAAIGRVQLQRLSNEFAPKRRAWACLYRAKLKSIAGIKFLQSDLDSIIPHIQPILVPAIHRDSLRQYLSDKGIETGIHYMPNHLLTFFGDRNDRLPVTEQLYEELLSLPLHPGLTESDVNYVTDRVSEFGAATFPVDGND